MIARRAVPVLRRLLKQFPAVTILGPRQCGKTTFIRRELPDWTYLDMERPSHQAPLSEDPEARIGQIHSRLVLDEAQRLPALFPVLRSAIDAERRRKGRFVLLGSASPTLIGHISESLAGRTGFLDMTPFSFDEVAAKAGARPLASLWLRGGFPDAFLEKSSAARLQWFEAYSRTFIERDLAALGIDVSSPQMRKLWTMLAHYNGGIWNASQLAASMGVSYHTVNRYVDILEQTFLLRKLPPYFVNIGKRLVKSPKIYFRDSGLLHYFLGIMDQRSLGVHPARGASWESFIVEQLICAFQQAMPSARAYYWRTAAGEEADLLIEAGRRLIPFEIKLHSAPTRQIAPGLRGCMRELKLSKGYVVYPGKESYSLGEGVIALSAAQTLRDPERLKEL